MKGGAQTALALGQFEGVCKEFVDSRVQYWYKAFDASILFGISTTDKQRAQVTCTAAKN